MILFKYIEDKDVFQTFYTTKLSKRLIDGINERVSHVIRNGDVNGYPGCVNLSFSYVEGESLLMALKVSRLVVLREYDMLTLRT